MSLSLLLLAALGGVSGDDGESVITNLAGDAVRASADFTIAKSPYVLGGTYLSSRSQASGAAPGTIRVAAPAGEYYVYLAWARHPQGAKDVRVRLGSLEVKVDQSRLANGVSPDVFNRNDMPQYDGLCSSGLYRITDRPVELREGDTLEVFRSDTDPDTLTTLDYVVFSPFLYLDDLGSDAAATGQPTINLKDYGRRSSGEVGFGLAFLKRGASDTAIEWTVPREGLFVLSAKPNRGPSRADAIPLQLVTTDGEVVTSQMAGKSGSYGRANWQDLMFVRAEQIAKVRLLPGRGGVACADLLRMRPVAESQLTGADARPLRTFVVQWEAPTPRRPWLSRVKIVPDEGGEVEVTKLEGNREMPNLARVSLMRRQLPLLGDSGGRSLLLPAGGSFRVELADDRGFTVSAELLLREPFVWLRDLGIFACRDGDFESNKSGTAALQAKVEAARKLPFLSTSEKYFELTGYDEARNNLVDRAFEFAYDLGRSPAPRVTESLRTMEEIDHSYFCRRIADVKHRRMFLGWPNVAQEFYVLSNGSIGTSSGSAHGTGHPPAESFIADFAAGDRPRFLEHGDTSVVQSIESGYQLIVHTEFQQPDTGVRVTALAYPLAGEEVRSGNEPLAAFVRFQRTSGSGPLWIRVKPAHWGGAKNPLADLAKARIEDGRLLAAQRIVLGFDSATATIESAGDDEVLVKILPKADRADLVIPYVAVKPDLVANAVRLGFEETLSRTEKYWDARLAKGATVEVPDPVVVNQYKTLYPRTMITGDLDVEGDYALKTSPIIYDRVWLHATAYGIEGLARRGHFEEARQYLEAGFRWQGSQAGEASDVYTTWDGFFNAPERYTAILWLNYHGWFQWAAARYYLFSDDQEWLEAKLPALIESLEWTAAGRKLTMRENPDGSRPINHGWLPGGRVTDGSSGTSTFTDCINWMGFNEVVNLLERIGDARGPEFRRVADDYRRSVLRGLRLAARDREPVRLNDGTFVPYVPGYLESEGHEETMWYAAVVDGALEGILDSGIVPPDDPLEDWVLGNLEDNLFVAAPNLADEGHFLGHGCGYLRRDQPEHAIYTLYSTLATQMARQTMTTYEHRSWGERRVYELAPWPMGYYTRMLAGMLCYDEGDELVYCRATPRKWLDPGGKIRVERLQTRFGPTSFSLTAAGDRVVGSIDLPTRYRPGVVKLRLRLDGRVDWVKLDGRPATFDGKTETVTIPRDGQHVRIEAGVERDP